MQTHWGDIEVSDAHVHFFSSSFFSALAKQRSATRIGSATENPDAIAQILGWTPPPAAAEDLGALWVRELDRHGVQRASLIASVPADEQSVAAAVERYPDRFYGYFMLNPLAPDAAKRVSTALEGGRLQIVCLFPAMHRFAMHDEAVRTVLDLATTHAGSAVFVHCGVLTVGVRSKLGLSSAFDLRFSNPVDLHAMALAYPKLNFVVPHFGAGYFREALMLCDLCPNVYLDTSSSNSWTRYQTEAQDLATVFRRALDVAGAGRLLFGTDSSYFPRGWNSTIFESQSSALRQIGVSAADARRIFGENLQQLLAR